MTAYFWAGPSGVCDWNSPSNWTPSGVPATGDTVFITAGSSRIELGLDQSGVALADLQIGMGFVGSIGTATDYLQINTGSWTIGAQPPNSPSAGGSPRLMLDFGVYPFNGVVLNTAANSLDAGLEPLRIRARNNSNTLLVRAGRVGIGTNQPGEDVLIGQVIIRGGVVNYGREDGAANWSVITNYGGTLNIFSGGYQLNHFGGVLNTFGSGAIEYLNVGGQANLYHRSSGTYSINFLKIFSNGVVDFSVNPRNIAINNSVQMYKDSTLIAFSSGQVQQPYSSQLSVVSVNCLMEDLTIDLGSSVILGIAQG